MSSRSQTDVSLKELGIVMRRQIWWVVGLTLITLGMGLGLAALTAPEYRSFTRLFVAGKTPAFQGSAEPDPMQIIASPSPIPDVPTQIEVLQGIDMLSRACNDVGVTLQQDQATLKTDPQIVVREVGPTSVLEIAIDSKSQNAAQQVAGQVANTYRTYLNDLVKKQSENAVQFLDNLIEKQRLVVQDLGKKLQKYREENRVTGAESDAFDRAGRVTRALQSMRDAEAAKKATDEDVASLEAQLKNVPKYLDEDVRSTNVEMRAKLQGQLADLNSEREALLTRYTEEADQVKEIDSRIAAAKHEMASLPTDGQLTHSKHLNQTWVTLDADLIRARASQAASNAAYAARSQEFDATQKDLVTFTGSQGAHLELVRTLSDETTTLQQRLKAREEFIIRGNGVRNQVTVVTPATQAIQVKPNWYLYALGGLIIGLIGSIPLVRWRERKEDKVRTADEAYEIAGALPLGHIPALRATAGNGKALAKVDPTTARFESFRVLRSNLLTAMKDQSVKTVMVTSAGRREGKTDLAYNLAVAMAIDGKKVILVDGNLRQSSLHTKLGLEEAPGLSDILQVAMPETLDDAWHKQFQDKILECVRPSDSENMHLMTAGRAVEAPVEALSSEQMKEFHDFIRNRYDLVIFDSASFVTPADPQALAQVVDGVLVVINVGSTKKAAIRYAMDLLRQARARVLGVVFNKIEGSSDHIPHFYRQSG
ncbi:MAG: polysaccharide biosynthesis tyrosine autokinase [Armatimonadetes bacterium]|nr:polysaccharide biosynthesis tyrosine autokinase [Armatimonadota bacterium]